MNHFEIKREYEFDIKNIYYVCSMNDKNFQYLSDIFCPFENEIQNSQYEEMSVE